MQREQFAVTITKVPGGAKPALTDGTKTVAEIFEEVFNEKINGYQVTVNGEERTYDYIVREGARINVAKMVKGNR